MSVFHCTSGVKEVEIIWDFAQKYDILVHFLHKDILDNGAISYTYEIEMDYDDAIIFALTTKGITIKIKP